MGQQQFLLITLGVIIVGVATAAGLQLLAADHTESNKDGVTSSLVSIAADAYQYKLRPSTLGGGSGRYSGYGIPAKMKSDDNGAYAVSSVTAAKCVFTGTSSINAAWIAACTSDDSGKTAISYSGW